MKFPVHVIGIVGWLVFSGVQTGCRGDEASVNGAAGGATNAAGASGGGSSGLTTVDAKGGSAGTLIGGSPNNTDAGGRAGVGGAAVRSGQILLVSLRRNNASPTQSMIANFFSHLTSDCASQAYGDCTFTPPCSTSYEPLYVSAGTLTVTSSNSTVNVSMAPSADNTYVSVATATGLSGGEALHFSATGGTIPAFSSDVTVALVLLIDSPAPNSNGEISANLTQDLVLRFSRGGAGVQLYAQSTTGSGTLVCTSASAASTLIIPATALTALGSGATLSLWTLTTRVVSAGGFDITTGAVMDAFTPDKSHPVTVTTQ